MDVVLLGMPGSGKGTLAAPLSAVLGVPHVSTGELFRRAMDEGTPLGEEVRSLMEAGRFVPDATVLGVVAASLDGTLSGGFILDGFPRTIPQARDFEFMLADRNRGLDCVIFLDLPLAAARERLLARRQCPSCGRIGSAGEGESCPACGTATERRSDDERTKIALRFKDYATQTEPLVGFYRDRGLLRRIDATEPPELRLAEAIQWCRTNE